MRWHRCWALMPSMWSKPYAKGETVSDYINRYRLEHVARLLKNTNHPIAVIGETSGIPSRATLGRLFRIAYGMTPSEYRNTTPKY